MEKVGVREIKNSLSRYLRRVKKGESIIITQRGNAIARLVPVEQENLPQGADELLKSSEATWRGGKPGLNPLIVPAKVGGITVGDMVAEDRR